MKAGGIARAAGAALAGAAVIAILVGERKRRLRTPASTAPGRLATNLALGVSSAVTASLMRRVLVDPVAARVAAKGQGIAPRLPGPGWLREAAAFLLLDYTIYLWHVATHKVPAFWRFHLVHHADLSLDASTALRFHAVDMLVSAPVSALQLRLIGPAPATLRAWRMFFFLSVLFHHSNLRLPRRAERRLALVLTTPRMHGIHHSAARDRTDSNWSSGLSLWDHLHGTFRLDVPQAPDAIGVPAYRNPREVGLGPSLRLPFAPQRDAWAGPELSLPRFPDD